MEKVLILDGNSIINRAYYGIRELSNSKGFPTNAIYGFINIISKYIDKLEPKYKICAFDTKKPTFRHKMYDKYKSNRHGMPDELALQMPVMKEILSCLGFMNIEIEGFEADDIIGTSAAESEKAGLKPYILTGDRDSLQLISETTTVILLKNKEDEIYTLEHFKDVYGITPLQYIDVKAIMGDSSDCIPGIKGIGEKGAFNLIKAYGDLDGVLSDDKDNTLFSKSIYEKINADRDGAVMSRKLAEISKTCFSLNDYDIFSEKGTESNRLFDLLTDLELFSIIKKYNLRRENNYGEEAKNEAILLKETSDLSDFEDDKTVLIHIIGERVLIMSLRDFKYASVSLSDPGFASFLEVREVVCFDIKNTYKILSKYNTLPKCSFDIMLAVYLCYPNYNKIDLPLIFSLSSSDDDGKDITVLTSLYSTYIRLEKELKDKEMSDILYNIEIPLAYILADTENIGFRIDTAGIKRFTDELSSVQKKTEKQIYSLAGKEINLNSPKQLSSLLYEDLKLPKPKKTSLGYSTDADTLNDLSAYHPVVNLIIKYRQISKLIGTYGYSLAEMADQNEILHTTLNQTGTITGRLSSSNPNLQNIPVREEIGREYRKFFTVRNENNILLDADYSQIELRLLAHISKDKEMIKAFINGEDIHTQTAAGIFGIEPEMVTHEMRSRAKTINFGIIYGMSAFRLSKDLKIPRYEAQSYIDSYFEKYTGVYEYLSNAITEAKEKGYTSTIFGRRRYIPELKSTNGNTRALGERLAKNSPIQGSAADIIKIAMINVGRKIREVGFNARIIMQIHDELIIECPSSEKEEVRKLLVYEMEHAAKLSVPLLAECNEGKNWYEAK